MIRKEDLVYYKFSRAEESIREALLLALIVKTHSGVKNIAAIKKHIASDH